jgi:multicomponent Na+:H+ antiporter subunit A
MLNLLIIYFLLALGIFILPKQIKSQKGVFIAVVQLATFIWFASKIQFISAENHVTIFMNWIPELGLNIEFLLDGLSLAFALLVSGIGALVFLYAHSYMKSYDYTDKFFFFLFLFSGAMLGMVMSANLIQLFIFWEFTTVLSFFLISFFHEKELARKAAFQSLVITFFGGLGLLAGILLIGSVVDSYSLTDWIAGSEKIKQSSLYLPGLLLILLGVFTKSAQFPFHFWLPGAMQAPAPVSAYLHSATMVKAGIFLLARLSPALGGTAEWTFIIPLFGVVTMLIGSYFAITQTDLKAILAYTTINALGILILLIGIDTKLSIKAAVLFLFIHAFYKASLFMIAGFIEKKTGTRDINELGGLIKSFPITFGIALLALLSMAGLPPMLGFLGKELIYETKVQSPGFGSLIFIFGVISNILMFAVSMRVLFKVFLGKPKNSYTVSKIKNVMFVLGPGLLVLLSLIFGISPNILGKWIVDPAMSVIYAEPVKTELKLWHGFNLVLLLSLATVAVGTLLSYILIKKDWVEEKWRKVNRIIFPVRFPEVFSIALEKFVAISVSKTKMLQHGYHRYYILTIILFTAALLWLQLYFTRGWQLETALTFQPFYISGLVLIIILATLFTVLTRSRIAAIIAMGVMGYGLSLIFLYYSAVDLAITQILAETLTVVMFMLILQRLPVFAKLSEKATKIRDFIVASIFGSAMTIVAIKAINVDFNNPISEYFMANSYDKAFGKNVVNVILVDFRALDTLGEVTVLVVAALGVAALLTSKKPKT